MLLYFDLVAIAGANGRRTVACGVLSILRRMPDVEYFDDVSPHGIRHDIRQPFVKQFPGTCFATSSAAVGKLLERADGLVNLHDRGVRQVGMVFLEIVIDAF
jgi:hypothetical protein